MMTQVNAYINFNGQCREAMEYYQTCFGGELNLQTISQSPMAAQMPSYKASHILHGSFIHASFTIMGSDISGNNFVQGNNISLHLQCSSSVDIETHFETLSASGKITMPLHQTFWGATLGELTDKFGINWILSYSKNN